MRVLARQGPYSSCVMPEEQRKGEEPVQARKEKLECEESASEEAPQKSGVQASKNIASDLRHLCAMGPQTETRMV